MANWKKVIVSGSNAELNHITASGDVSASGFLFGNLPSGNHDEVVIYNTTTGRLEFKVLNLISTTAAPRLFLADQVNSDNTTANFRLSYDTGSSAVGGGVVPYTRLSASAETPGTYDVLPSNNISWIGINDQWVAEVDNDGNSGTTFYEGATNITGSVSGSRNGLIKGQSAQTPITISLNAVNDNSNAVPSFNSSEVNKNYLAKSFNDGGIGELRIYANDNEIDSPARIIDLTDYDAITGTSNFITIDLSPTRSNADGTTGDPDPTKHARSGSFVVGTGIQNDGYNYAYALHTGSKDGTDFAYITNFVEWFYDEDGASNDLGNVTGDTVTTPTFNANVTQSISGIKFYTSTAADSATITHKAGITNFYRNIYPTANGISYVNVTNDSIDSFQITSKGSHVVTDANPSTNPGSSTVSVNIPSLNNTANAYTSTLNVTSSIGMSFAGATFHQPNDFQNIYQYNSATSLAFNSFDIAFKVQFDHLSSHKTTPQKQGGLKQIESYMINNLSNNSNEHEFESFRLENYRIQSQSGYENTSQAAINTNTGSILDETYKWDSEVNVVNGGGGHNEGAIQYYTHLYDPRHPGDGSSTPFATDLGPLNDQPTNYGTATGVRTYYRYFKLKSTQAGTKSLTFEIIGNGKICRDGDTTNFAIGGEGVKMYFWRSRGNEDPSSTSVCNGTFVNVVDSSLRVGNAVNNDSRYIDIRPSFSNIDFGSDNTLDGEGFEIGAVKISDTNGSTFKANEVLIVKFEVPQQWSGNIDALALRKGSVGDGTQTYLGYSNSGIDGNDNYTSTQL